MSKVEPYLILRKDVKEKWLEALRSKKYKQGKRALKTKSPYGDTFCCLGVLCDVLKPDGWKNMRYNVDEHEYSVNTSYLSGDFCVDIGLLPSFQETLACMNDGENEYKESKSFFEIADWIERNI